MRIKNNNQYPHKSQQEIQKSCCHVVPCSCRGKCMRSEHWIKTISDRVSPFSQPLNRSVHSSYLSMHHPPFQELIRLLQNLHHYFFPLTQPQLLTTPPHLSWYPFNPSCLIFINDNSYSSERPFIPRSSMESADKIP